jgi:biotin carboxyl carrier protein
MTQEFVEAPLNGRIIEVDVTPGDTVREGETLVVLESMKMENPIVAPIDGNIIRVNVRVGQVVKRGEIIVVIEG